MNQMYRKPSFFSISVFLYIVVVSFIATFAFYRHGLENAQFVTDSSLELIGLITIAVLSSSILSFSTNNPRIASMCLLMVSIVSMLSLDIVYCSVSTLIDTFQASVFCTATTLLSSMIYFSTAHYVYTTYRDRIANPPLIRKILTISFVAVAALILPNPFVETFGYVEEGVIRYTYGAIALVALNLIPAFTVFFILAKYGRREPTTILLWLYQIAVIMGVVLQLFDGSLYYTVIMASYGFVFIYSVEYISRKYMIANSISEDREVDDLALSSQLTPHFLFNSLSSIMNLPSNNEESLEALGEFSSFLRFSIDYANVIRAIPVDQELDHTESYIRVQKCEMGDRIEFTTDITNDGFSIPPFTLKSLASQVIGTHASDPDYKVRISIKTEKVHRTHRILFNAEVSAPVSGCPATPVLDNERMATLTERLRYMVRGTISQTLSKKNVATVIIDIPEANDDL